MVTKLAKCKIINIDFKMITTLTPSVSRQKNGINLSRRECRVSGFTYMLFVFLKKLKIWVIHMPWHLTYFRILLMDFRDFSLMLFRFLPYLNLIAFLFLLRHLHIWHKHSQKFTDDESFHLQLAVFLLAINKKPLL